MCEHTNDIYRVTETDEMFDAFELMCYYCKLDLRVTHFSYCVTHLDAVEWLADIAEYVTEHAKDEQMFDNVLASVEFRCDCCNYAYSYSYNEIRGWE